MVVRDEAIPNYGTSGKTFTIQKQANHNYPGWLWPRGTRIYPGDPISFRSHLGYYLMAQNGGGSTLTATATVPWLWETFYLVFW